MLVIMCAGCGTMFNARQGDSGECPRCGRESNHMGFKKKIGAKEIIIVHGLNARIAAIKARIDAMNADGGYSEGCFLQYAEEIDLIAGKIEEIAEGEE